MSPIGRKALGVELDSTPPCTFAAAPTCSSSPLSSVPCVKHTEHIRPAYSSLVPRLPLTALVEVLDIAARHPPSLCHVFSIPSTFDPPTPASYLSFHLRRGRSARYCDILSTPVCIDVLEWSSRFNLSLVSKTKQGTFDEKVAR